MLTKNRVLVVGTTADYIELLDRRFFGKVLFLTRKEERAGWRGKKPLEENEVLCFSDNYDVVLEALKLHLKKYAFKLSAVACFDCDSLRLASRLAQAFDIPFSSEQSVLLCRSKYHSKKVWQQNNVPCPKTALVNVKKDVLEFFHKLQKPVVLKPLTGSGSELVFLCHDETSCIAAFNCVEEKVRSHPNQRMYGQESQLDQGSVGNAVCIEEFIGGEEYSCDFMMDKEDVRIIRLSKKIPFKGSSFGSIFAYQLPADLPDGLDEGYLCDLLKKASQSLGLKRTMAMVDFKIDGHEVFFLELTPRPGGDCIPPLIEASSGFDILKSAVDFADGKEIIIPDKNQWLPLVGLHLFATEEGKIARLDTDLLVNDPRVIKYHLKRRVGDLVRLPPEDYDSRILGWVIFRPYVDMSLENQCYDLLHKLTVIMSKEYAAA